MGRPTGVALLGSTGSIGRQALDVLESAGTERFRIVTLAAGSDAATLSEQAQRLKPACIALADADARRRLAPIDGVEQLDGPDAMEMMAVRDDVDLVVVGTGGVVSLRPVLAALRSGKVVATANKETLVAGGHLVMPLAHELGDEARATGSDPELGSALAWVRPIDSEHSALWQCLVGEDLDSVQRLILTASGGPFREWPASRLREARPADALKHPTWDMGAKITIDSATLMNKGLEVIEAHWLYDVDYDRIDVVIHPQSLIHSLVEFVDGSMKAQLGLPDMRIPIQYAVTYPRRQEGPAPRLDLVANDTMTFEAPDESRFRALSVARSAGRAGPRATTALIAADDVGVERFLEGSLSFDGISQLVEVAVEHFGEGPPPGLEELEALDAEIRSWSRSARVGASA